MNNIAYCQRLSMVLPEELRLLKQFLLWRLEPNKNGKPTKVPHRCVGGKASSTDPNTWSSFGFALECMRKANWATGIGFVFTADDPYCGIDLDNIWQSDADEGAPWARNILEWSKDTYGEASPSDTGYKIWCKAKLARCHKWPIGAGKIEIYDKDRFFTLTGASNQIRIVANHQAEVDGLLKTFASVPAAAEETVSTAVTPFGTKHRVFPREIPEGDRHDSLVSFCGTLRRRGLCSETIESCLLAMNRDHCQEKYDLDHIRQIMKGIK